MAGTIKGISVSIGGNTIDLQSSLKDVEKISRNLQSELTQVNKQLKFDPSNSVLLAQKQDILEERIANTKLTLEKLLAVQDQVEEQAKTGELGADKYRAYQREIESTKGVLRNLEQQLKDTQTAQNNLENNLNDTNLTPATKEVEELKDEVGNLEKKANSTDLSDFKKEMDDVKSSANELKDTLKDTVAEVGTGVAAVGGVGAAALMSFDSVESALNHIQASTGLDTSSIEKYRDVLESLYQNNYGDNMDDIATKMANVVQFTNETDPAKIEKYVQNLSGLEDTFGYDIAENLRAVNMLIDQFGISADEAFNLIVQGSQKGLNKNGDLLDTINEYSVHYKQQGYNAEQFFNSLENGASSGTFSIDKLGDAMKEFGIRSKDTANSTTEGFELLNLDADKMREAFAKGGDSAREATEKTLSALFSLDDTVKQNQAGVDLFGTMWEDLGIDGVKALMDVNGTADKTVSSMEKLNEVKYDDVQSKLKTLGKKAQTEIINPLIKDAYPKIEDGVEWITDNLDSLIPILEGLARQAAIVWGVKKTTEVVKDVKNLISSYKTLTTATSGAANAQKGLNFAQKANVVAAVATAVLTLVNAVSTYQETQWENSSLKKEIDKIKECTEEWNNLADDMASYSAQINETELDLKVNFEQVEEMKSRLQEIIQDGTISEGEEGEYKTIIDLLGEKVDGFETHWNNLTLEEVDGEIKIKENIDDVNKKLDELVENWEIAQAKITYTDILSNTQVEVAKKEAELKGLDTGDIENSKRELEKYIFDNSRLSSEESKFLTDELLKADGNLEKTANSIRKQLDNGTLDKSTYGNISEIVGDKFYTPKGSIKTLFWNFDAEDRLKEYTDSIVENQNAVDKAEAELKSLKNTCSDYESALKAINGSQTDYNALISLHTKWGMSQDAVLSLVKDKNIKTWDDLKKAAEEKGTELTEKTKEKARNAGRGYDEFNPRKPVKEGLNEAESAVEESGVTLSEKTKTAATNAQNSAKISGWFGVGSGFISSMISGIFSKNTDSNDAGETAAEEAKTGAGSVSLFQKGVSLISGFISGIGSKKEDSKKAGESVAKKTETGASSVSLFSLGDNLVGGFINGIKTGKAFQKIGEAAKSVAKNAYDSIKSWLGIKSPSKETEKLGKYFSEGFAIGIDKNSGLANSAASELAKTAHNNLKKINISNTLGNLQTLQNANTGSNISANTTKTITNAPTINVNISDVTINNDTDIDAFANRISERLGDFIVQEGSKWG